MTRSWCFLAVLVLTPALVPGSSWNPTSIAHADDSASIQLLLQDPLAFESPADRCAPPICTRLVEWIDEAEGSIDFAVYGARNQSRILTALVDAKRRGVRVRGYVDRGLNGETYYASTNDWVRELGSIADDQARERQSERKFFKPPCPRPEGFKGPVQCLAYDLGHSWLLAEHASREDFTDASSVNKIMHNKFFVIDRRRVWTGSANLSDSGTGGYNANIALALQSASVAKRYSAEFERLLVRGADTHKGTRSNDCPDETQPVRVGDAQVSVLFTPQDDPMESGVRPLLASAEERIDVAMFFLTHKRVTADLIAAHRRGVKVRVILDATSAQNGYTKHELLRTAGVPTKIENWGGKMHAKAAVIDGQYLITGSMNWTAAGEGDNDENTLLIHAPRLASEFTAWFDGLWRDIPDLWLAENARPDPESRNSGSACFDGVDNDFDRLVDDEDPGCNSFPPAMHPLPPHRIIAKAGDTPPRTHVLYPEQAKGVSPNPLLVADSQCSATDGFQCGAKRYCGEMKSCAEARFFLTHCGLTRLDGNNDGVPCEALCRDESAVGAVSAAEF